MAQSQNYKKLLKFVLAWTGKEPLLTQLLFRMMLDTEEPPIAGEEARWVDELVRSRLLKTWESDPQMKPLQMLRDRLTKNRDKRHSLKLLRCYRQILTDPETFAENSPEQNELRLLGLLVQNRGRITVHNRIYEAIFDRDWTNRAIGKLEQTIGPDDEEFLRTFEQLERRLLASQSEIVAQIDDGRTDVDVNRAVHEVLREVTNKLGHLVGADRTSVFLLNDEQTELWSLVAEDATGKLLDIRVRVGQGIAGLVAREKRVIHIPDNVYDDPRSRLVQESDQKYNYYTKNILAFPILNDNMDLVAVVQLLNKLAKSDESDGSEASFTHGDLEQLAKCVLPIRKILETCQSTYEAIKRAQASAALAKATRSLDQVNLDTSMILERVMDAAKELLNADRSTLWLYDDQVGDLWTRLPSDGEIRCPMGVGFAGQVAASGKLMNIPFDLYDDPNAENAKRIDAQTRYRTCSLLCMPVLSPDGELLGVTQLVNKRKAEFPEATYDPQTYPDVPPVFQTSFDRNDRQSMQVFNERVGAILQFAKTHETLKASSPAPPPPTAAPAAPPPAPAPQSLTLADFFPVWQQALNLEQDPTLGTETFYGVLTGLALSLCRQLQADYAQFFFVDRQTQDLWTLVFDPRSQRVKEVRLPMNRGIAAKLLGDRSPKKSNKAAQIQDALVRLGLRRSQVEELRNVLFYPLLDDQNTPIGILRLLNKQLDEAGGGDFTAEDIQQLRTLTPRLVAMLALFEQFHLQPTVRQAS
ncbi:MAG: GAF domain-containing protein [Cyanobacteria bacterium P01_G01_bin.54]